MDEPSPGLPEVTPPPPRPSHWSVFTQSLGGKLTMIVSMLVIMLIPASMVSGEVNERQARQESVRNEFRTSWGPIQTVRGPILVIPFTTPEKAKDGTFPRHYLHLAPDTLDAVAKMAPETRKRGMFHATVYTGDIALKGTFRLPRSAVTDQPDATILWSESFVILGAVSWNGAQVDGGLRVGGVSHAFEDAVPPGYQNCIGAELIAARAPVEPSALVDGELPFETSIAVAGTETLALVLAGRRSNVRISGAWASPSFDGAILPVSSTVTDAGFDAVWRDGGRGRGTAGIWTTIQGDTCRAAAGVRALTARPVSAQLMEAVPTYRMVYRASNYATLFLVLSFLTYFLFEVIRGVRIHIVQYGLLGLSMSLFALLLISFSEPLGFAAGYAISALAILLQASLFTASVTRNVREATIFAGVMAGLFGFLYVVLTRENYALLAGTVALFSVLSVVMLVTRRLDWSGRLG